MARVKGNIPNFINGISQQPPELRLASQGAAQENCYSTVAKGLKRRPPTDHVAKIVGSVGDNVFTHIINRDVNERYIVIIDPDDTQKLRVYDFAGDEKEVSFPNGDSYLDALDAETTIKALTVADYTFIVNSSIKVEADNATSPAEEYSCLISVQTVQPGTTVKVIVNGTTVASYDTSDTDPSDLETNFIAGKIRAGIASTAPTNASPWSVSLTETEGSVVYLKNSSADFKISVRDGSNGLGIKIIKRKVQYFEDLPRQGKNGFKVEVAGDPVTGFGNYWVEFEGNENGVPVWKESMAPGILTKIKASTMPHKLTRNYDGTFTFDVVDWAERKVGDDNNNPMPSFVGETINDIYFTEGRLAVLAAENTIMSEAGEYFNFFRTTVTTLVDGDPIDVGTNHTKVSILRHAVPYQEQLLLFSDQTQFRLTKGDVLSPQTVGIEPITEFESSILAKPAPVGNFVFFAVEKSDYASIREYYVADQNLRNDARDITGHVPNYIPSGVTNIEGSSNEDVMFITAASEPNVMYVYKYFWSGDQKVQSSWSRWSWPGVERILGRHFIQSTLYLVVKRSDGVFLEKMEMDAGAQDASGTGYVLLMDRKVISTDEDNVSAEYDAETNQTTYTFSQITWKSVPKIVGIAGNSDDYPPGYEVAIVDNPDTYDSNTIVVEGDTTSETFLFGIPFDSTYEMSQVVVKNRLANGTETPTGEGRLQLMWMTVVYADTGYLKVLVDTEGREQNIYEYTGRTIGADTNALNSLPVGSGQLRVPVFTKASRAKITLTSNSILPWQIISADWIGNFVQKFRSI